QVEMEGLSGKIAFDSHGFRTDFNLDLLELLNPKGLTKVGTWNRQDKVKFTPPPEVDVKNSSSLFDRTLVVTTFLGPPYTMFKESPRLLTGNDRFEGFCIDLIEEIAHRLGFNYTFKLVDDKQYGKYVKDPNHEKGGYWNGMIGEVINGVADMAIADLTINYVRSEVVDFTTPWMNIGGILYQKPTKKPPNLFSFLSPLSLDVWLYMAAAYFGVSILLFLLARFTPYEWVNPYPCVEEPEELENELTLSNAFWHNWGSLMQQGSDIAPKAVSTRMVAGMWWFFTLIMISSYTANLAAFLTVERLESPIESAEDLSQQGEGMRDAREKKEEDGSTACTMHDPSPLPLAVLVVLIGSVRPLPQAIRVGALLGDRDPGLEIAFKYGLRTVNGNYSLLPDTTLIPQVDWIHPRSSWDAEQRVCKMLKTGVAGIFGPMEPSAASHVQSICDAFEIPHVEMRWDYKEEKEVYTVNLHPHTRSLGKAYYDAVVAYRWKSFTVAFQDDESLLRLKDVIQATDGKQLHERVRVRRLPKDLRDFRPTLQELKNLGETQIVVDLQTDLIRDFLWQAQQVGMLTDKQSYLFTSLDLHTLDLEDFKYGGTNITGFRLVDVTRRNVSDIVMAWIAGERESGRTSGANGGINLIFVSVDQTETALMYDAVLVFARALHQLDHSQKVDVKGLDCGQNDAWEHGNSLTNYMKMVEMEGLSGKIAFDSHGFRTDFNLDLLELLNPKGLTKVGTWNRQDKVKFTPPPEVDVKNSSSLFDRTLVVTTSLVRESFILLIYIFRIFANPHEKQDENRKQFWNRSRAKKQGQMRKNVKQNARMEERSHAPGPRRTLGIAHDREGTATNDRRSRGGPPYTMFKESPRLLTGNDRFEGFCIDLIEEIAHRLGFNYTFKLVDDKQYGKFVKDPNHEKGGYWNGMIGEVINGVADMAIADLTINYVRSEAVDFTTPWMNIGISILYQKPTKKPPNLLSFLSPLSLDVWLYMAAAYFGVSILLFFLGRFTPYEWVNPYPCVKEREKLENELTLSNAFWHNWGSLMQQGSDIAPKAVSTRLVAGMWWFFTLIMISSYTANLAAFLTVERLESPIESAEDLSQQTKIKYGCVSGGSTHSFFQSSTLPTFNRMYNFMEAHPDVLTKNNEEGMERVMKSNGMYAYLMESSTIEYMVERNCELAQIGGLLDNKGYGIGLSLGERFLGFFGWFWEVFGDLWGFGMASGGSSKPAELGLANVGGVFVVLLGGMGISCVIAAGELLWGSKQTAEKEQILKELKFALKCRGSTKPVNKEGLSRGPSIPRFPVYSYSGGVRQEMNA
ncbi:unnamed protein product, partial [Darwinula stevensoni]